MIEPTLEVALEIGRNAKDKPRRVFETLRERELKDMPAPLVQAVEALFSGM